MDAKKERSLSRIREELAMYEPVVEVLKLDPGEMGHLQLPILENIIEQHRGTIEARDDGYADRPELVLEPHNRLASVRP